ncbi:MAG: hypothetical protein KC766_26310 [Myxococcales bacterium]|nr:hypothetical protein [Myxococcales bacterium]
MTYLRTLRFSWMGVALGAYALGSFSLGCGPIVAKRTVEYTIEQRGLVPAPSGPKSVGSMIKGRRVALEGGVSGSPVFRSNDSRYQDESGDVVANTSAFGRFIFAAGDHFEVSFSGEYAREELATQVARDREQPRLGRRYTMRFGPAMRWLFYKGEDVSFGGLAEAELASLPYSRTVYARSFLTQGTDPDTNWWESDTLRTQYLGEEVSSKRDEEDFLFARLGFFLSGPLSDSLSLGFGVLMQSYPHFFGVRTAVEQCDVFASGTELCSGDEPEDIEPLESSTLNTAFLWLSEELDQHTTLTAQLYGHLGGDSGHMPFGGALSVRYAFGEPPRARPSSPGK